jgi:hypothetical protein
MLLQAVIFVHMNVVLVSLLVCGMLCSSCYCEVLFVIIVLKCP